MSPKQGGGRRRWGREIRGLLADFPRQYAALQHAMDEFGPDFDLRAFKRAFAETEDMDVYGRVQLVEHAITRVQTYVADLAIAGAKLAALELPTGVGGGAAERAFSALAEAGVVDRPLVSRLTDVQRARNRIQHGYVDLSAGEVHRAAKEVSEGSMEFLRRYRPWIEPFLEN
ncbi:MAG TPA: hypothetical protein VGI73_14745 [Solirubrobacterales bacterium]|jgi:uncharacterized protein YutE (UPF0331/DUF86 family)